MSVRTLKFNLSILLVGLPFLAIALILPFDFFVDIESIKYHDMCLGSNKQLVTADRRVRWVGAYKADVRGELFFYEAQLKLETSIKRNVEFVYQVEDYPITYEIVWNTSVEQLGEYGASDFITLDTRLGDKTAFFSEDEQRFSVILCD